MGSRPRIVVTRGIPEAALELLAGGGELWLSPHDRPLSTEELAQAAAGAAALVTLLHDRIDDALLDAAGPQLRVVANVAVGYDNIDVPACAARGVVVTNTPGVLTEATADIAFALILMATRRLGAAERFVRSAEPWAWNMFFMLGTGLQGKRLGIVGLGQIGAAVARRGRAFGMEVVYAGRRAAPEALERELGARRLPLEELLASADVVSLHCPLTPETRALIDAEALARMKPTAFLVNTTRGPVVVEAALAEALRDGVIAGAGLDVYEREPLVHPDLLGLENVVLLPHLGSATVETRTQMGLLAAHNALAVLAGDQPPTPVSPPAPAASASAG
jgi:glyoxylate reductase